MINNLDFFLLWLLLYLNRWAFRAFRWRNWFILIRGSGSFSRYSKPWGSPLLLLNRNSSLTFFSSWWALPLFGHLFILELFLIDFFRRWTFSSWSIISRFCDLFWRLTSSLFLLLFTCFFKLQCQWVWWFYHLKFLIAFFALCFILIWHLCSPGNWLLNKFIVKM